MDGTAAKVAKRPPTLYNTPKMMIVMKRPSCTSATQPAKTAQAMHSVFMAVVRALACARE